jgi:3',5'-cyclic AMP phosphodiesterase CpdA
VRTLAHLSDLHFGRLDEAILAPLRASLEAQAPDVLVVSGDLTQRARASQFRAARKWLDTLPKPQVVVPGNHDVPLYNVFARFAAPLANYRRIVSEELEPHYIDAEIAVIGVNTARSATFKGGRINGDQVARIRGKICALPDEVVKIVVTHHPFDVPKASRDGGQIVGRARMALEGLADCGADVFLSGHLHESHVGHTADHYRIAGLSALVVQAGTATSSRTRESPNSFNVLHLAGRHIEITQHAWTGSGFRPGPVQAFDHDGKGWHSSERRNRAPRPATP